MLPTSLPAPRLIPSESVPPLRWGIIGPGMIAEVFTDATHKHTTQRVVAVASQTLGRAEAFASARGIEVALESYEALLARPDIDVVYVATHPQHHRAHAELAIAAGKHVLIEKPLAPTAEDAAAIAAAAQAAGVLVMEAMWTRYLPQTDVIRQVLAEGILGEVKLVQSDFGQALLHIPRLVDPIAGGGLLDLGIYNFAFTSLVLGAAQKVSAAGTLTPSGVDDTVSVLLGYASGAQASITTSISAFTPTSASISGSAGMLTVGEPFFTPTSLTLFASEFNPAPVATWHDNSGIVAHEGLSYQATALASFVEQGLRDSPVRPLAEAVSDITLIQQARHQIGAFLTGESR
ncbi:Gfo/Idh/MocA family protein [Aurantimicrobium minutum]|uniref:Gfo/Idh/MocA family protein n=1 Tax=Aurantimicrobium minutum TaxID=708131 RepID=UPI002473942F|nr:Gfo/Idh/MocA family oxidoreductase [Aurantimicrobium minutum]MDH6423001.1 putative dehydrogenase [Aurantimicrobium minutum]